MGKKVSRRKRRYKRRRRTSRRYGGNPATQQKFQKAIKKLGAVQAFKEAGLDTQARRAYRRIELPTGRDTNPYSTQSKFPYTALQTAGPDVRRMLSVMERDPDITRERHEERAERRRAGIKYMQNQGILDAVRRREEAEKTTAAARVPKLRLRTRHGGRRRRTRRTRRTRRLVGVGAKRVCRRGGGWRYRRRQRKKY